MSTLTIHEDKIRNVLGNFHASELVYTTDFWRRESLSPIADTKKFSIEELSFLYGFDEEMITDIQYTIGIKERMKFPFKKIEDDFVRKNPKEYISQLQTLTFAEQEKMLFPDRTLFENLYEYFPTLPAFHVPGGSSCSGRVIVVLYPGIVEQHKPALMQFFQKERMDGSLIVMLPMAYFTANILYLLVKYYIVDAILSFYSSRAEQDGWYWMEHQLKVGIDPSIGSTTLFELLKQKQKNYNNDGYGGFDFGEVCRILEEIKQSCVLA